MDSADRDRQDALYTEVSTAHAACSWGRLSLTVSGLQAVQLSPSAKLQMLGASWLFMMTVIGLTLVWVALGKAARDREQILQDSRRN
jgi:hypothetical protein